MVSVPALAEDDLSDVIEGEFGLLVTLITPEGVRVEKTGDGKPLKGFVRHSYIETRQQRGASEKTIINSPVVKLRLSSLSEIPATGEKWMVGIPESPRADAEMIWYILDSNRPVEINRDKGTIKLFLVKTRGVQA